MSIRHPGLATCLLASLCLISLLTSPGAAAATDRAAPPAFDRQIATALSGSCTSCGLASFERTVLVDDIAHYRMELVVGDGPYDRIGLHRVVREHAPYRPHRSEKAIFLAHGIIVGFEGTFLANLRTDDVPADRALPVFLARNGIDVWGFDARWALLPPEAAADLSFLDTWGIAQDAADLDRGLRAARLGRLLTGSGAGRLFFLGYSRGGRNAYAYLNEESQRPAWRRQVRGFIALDAVFKAADEARRQASCDAVEVNRQLLADGHYADDFRFLRTAGALAEAAPDEPSPLPPFAGLTNRQAALAIATAPSATGFHLLGGTFDASGLPSGLRFAAESFFYRFLTGSSAFQPIRGSLDAVLIGCDEEDVPYDDHLADITVPVFYLGAAGGNTDAGAATTALLGSEDVTVQVVQLLSPEEKLFDIGHGAPLLADDAENLFWRPILEWIQAR